MDRIRVQIKNYLKTKDDKYLNDIVSDIENLFTPISVSETEELLKNFSIEEQKLFLKTALFDNRFINIQKTLLCTISNQKYQEDNYIVELFNTVKTDTNNILYGNLTCLSYIVAMVAKTKEIILQAINILKEHLKNNPNDFECIGWIGHIAINRNKFKNNIIEFLKSIQYNDDKAKIYAAFYIDIEDCNKKQYKRCLMKLISDKNKKEKRNDYLFSLYQNCLNCQNNEDLVNFSIKLIKSIPLKNASSKKIVFFISHICNSTIRNITKFESKFKNKIVKEVICFIRKRFLDTVKTINEKYFNYRFLYLDNLFIRNYITKSNQSKILKSLKRENYAPVLCYLAYEMNYFDYYQVYHPINAYLKNKTKDFLKSIIPKIKKYLKKYIIGVLSFFFVSFVLITITLILEQRPLTPNNYIHCLINKYTKDYK